MINLFFYDIMSIFYVGIKFEIDKLKIYVGPLTPVFEESAPRERQLLEPRRGSLSRR